MSERFDLAVVGSGPAGFNAALTAGRMGRRVAIIDREEMFGGVALRRGGIPSKALREAVLNVSGYQRSLFYPGNAPAVPVIDRQQLGDQVREVVRREAAEASRKLEGLDVTFVPGLARFRDANTLDVEGGTTISADFILIACGTRSYSHPGIPIDHDRMMNVDSMTSEDLIGEISSTLAVVGAGVIGLEYAAMASVLGIKVTVIDARAELLPFLDREIAAHLREHLTGRGVEFLLGEQIIGANRENDKVIIRFENGQRLTCDRLLHAGHRVANTDGLGLETIGLSIDERGLIAVDSQFRTAVATVYAAGDIVGFPALASTSVEQGRVAASHMFGVPCGYKLTSLPTGIYTIPEIGMVGMTEDQLASQGIAYAVGIARFSELVRGQIIGDNTGMLKLIFETKHHTLLGVHVIGTSATEILHIGHVTMMLGGTMEFLSDAVFNFPTMAEAYKVAAADGLGRILK